MARSQMAPDGGYADPERYAPVIATLPGKA
jgi:hypothetical protein